MLGPGSFYSMSISGHTVFSSNSKDFQVSFSLFVLKITSFFLERMSITVVPWRSTFFLQHFFNLMGATASNKEDSLKTGLTSSFMH